MWLNYALIYAIIPQLCNPNCRKCFLAGPYHLTDSCKVLEVTEFQFLRKSGRSPHTQLFLCFLHKFVINHLAAKTILDHEYYSLSLTSLLRFFETSPIEFHDEFKIVLCCKKVIFSIIFHIFCLFFLRQDQKKIF